MPLRGQGTSVARAKFDSHSSISITSEIFVRLLDEAKREKFLALDGYLREAILKGQRSRTTDA